MQIQPPQQIPFDPAQVADVFTRMKNGQDLTKILVGATTVEYYFYVKAYACVDRSGFLNYSELHTVPHRGRDNPQATPYHLMLHAVLAENHPPLEDCHAQIDGYIGLDDYVDIAKAIF